MYFRITVRAGQWAVRTNGVRHQFPYEFTTLAKYHSMKQTFSFRAPVTGWKFELPVSSVTTDDIIRDASGAEVQ